MENHLADGCAVSASGGVGCFWLVLLACFEFAVVQVGFHALASGLGGQLVSGGADHLDEFGGEVADEFRGIAFLKLHEPAPEEGGSEGLVGFAKGCWVFELADELQRGFGEGFGVFAVAFLLEPLFVAAEFPAGHVLDDETGMAEFSEFGDDVEVGFAVVEHGVDGGACVERQAGDFAVATG